MNRFYKRGQKQRGRVELTNILYFIGLPPVQSNAKLICPVTTVPGPGAGAFVAVAAHHAPWCGNELRAQATLA